MYTDHYAGLRSGFGSFCSLLGNSTDNLRGTDSTRELLCDASKLERIERLYHGQHFM